MVPTFNAETALRDYLQSRGWVAVKMDEGNMQNPHSEQAADWHFTLGTYHFLAEVKTIESARRGKSTEAALDQKHGLRRRLRHLSQQREWSSFPFDVLVDNQSLYAPTRVEVDNFVTWLREQLTLLATNTLPRGWGTTPLFIQGEPYITFFTRYLVGADSVLDVRVMPKSPLVLHQFDVNVYGRLNLSAVDGEIRKARKQLHKTTERLPKASVTLPRVVVLYFGLGLDLRHWRQLFEQVQNIFMQHQDLSAIAVLRFVPVSNDFRSHEVEMGFWVFHNDRNDLDCSLLEMSVFESPYSQQFNLDQLNGEIEKMKKSPLFF